MTEPALPGQPLDIPLPPEVDRAFGYTGQARYVAFHWSPAGDQVVYDDGRSSGSGQSWSFLAYRRHRAVAPLLQPFNLGYSDADAEHAVILDREANRASVAPVAEAHAFLRDRHPPEPPLTEEQREAFQREMERLLAEWRNQPIDHEAVARQMAEQRGRVGRMIAWLDMAPVPKEGRGA